jgi:hypothetical protein
MVTRVRGSVRRFGLQALAAALGAFACHRPPAIQELAPASASARAPGAAGAGSEHRIRELVSAEQRRASRDVTSDDLTNHDAGVRRAAARSLARI